MSHSLKPPASRELGCPFSQFHLYPALWQAAPQPRRWPLTQVSPSVPQQLKGAGAGDGGPPLHLTAWCVGEGAVRMPRRPSGADPGPGASPASEGQWGDPVVAGRRLLKVNEGGGPRGGGPRARGQDSCRGVVDAAAWSEGCRSKQSAFGPVCGVPPISLGGFNLLESLVHRLPVTRRLQILELCNPKSKSFHYSDPKLL